MKKLSKKNERILRKVASEMPLDTYQMNAKYKMKGSEVVKAGFSKETLDKLGEIDPDEEYVFNGPAAVEINHFRRMKKVFTKEGATALYNYMLKYVNPDKRHTVLTFVHSLK